LRSVLIGERIFSAAGLKGRTLPWVY